MIKYNKQNQLLMHNILSDFSNNQEINEVKIENDGIEA